jgi:hypothetical protein
MPEQRLHLSLPRAERPPLFRTELKVTVGLAGVLAAVGLAAVLTGQAERFAGSAPILPADPAALPADPDAVARLGTDDAAPAATGADEIEIARLPADRPVAEAPGLFQPSGPSPRPQIALDAPGEAARPAAASVGLYAVAQSIRPVLRPGLPDPATATATEEETVTAALDRSLRPRVRPDARILRAALDVAVDDAVAADAVATRRLPAPDQLELPAEVETVAFTPTAPDAASAASCPRRLVSDIPRRSPNAKGASRIIAELDGVDGGDRDRRFTRELLAGNMPDFLRRLTPVPITGRRADGSQVTVTLCVTPDYLAVGSETDYIRVPLGLPAAAMVADRLGFMLPTTRMVDVIFQQAGVRVAPSPMTPGAAMTSTRYFWQHNQTVDRQLRGRTGTLVAGSRRISCCPNACAATRAGWRSMAGTGPTAPRSSRSRPCMAPITPITATASGWSAAPPMSTAAPSRSRRSCRTRNMPGSSPTKARSSRPNG